MQRAFSAGLLCLASCFSHSGPDPVLCTADAMMCPDGTFVGRDSNNNCEFSPCPVVECTADALVCPDGTSVGRDSNNGCQFFPCPGGSVAVEAVIASVSLADDCPDVAADAVPPAECLVPPCDDGPNFCQQSSAQLHFDVSEGGEASLTFEILAARLLDADTQEVVDELETREPMTWSGDTYAPWDERLRSPSSVSASYKLSAPDWSNVYLNDGLRDSEDFFILELDVEIDGELRTLQSEPVSREPQIVT